MAELIDIKRVQIGPENMIAHVRIADDAPLMTSEDLEATARVYHVMPHIIEHVCLGDAGETFRDAMGDTELAHLLEHVTVELLAQTNLAGDMPAGRTWVDEVDDRTYQIELACPDDVLVAAALSCGVWILDWAYRGGDGPEPNVDAIVDGLVQLMQNVGDQGEDLVIDDGLLSEPINATLEDEVVEEALDEGAYEGVEYVDEPVEYADVAEEMLAEGLQAEAQPVEAEVEPVTDSSDEPAPSDAEVTGPLPGETAVQQPLQVTKPLWTQAPEVPTVARTHSLRYSREPVAPEMEAQIDEIMATIEMPALTVVEYDAHESNDRDASAE